MADVVVDVVAVAQRLLASQAASFGPNPGDNLTIDGAAPALVAALEEPEPPVWVVCVFGHENPLQSRFCPECGLPTAGHHDSQPAELVPPRPAAALTPQELVAREEAHRQALAVNAAMEAQAVPDFQPSQGEKIVIHFVDDGLSALGHVYLRGQEIAIGPDHPRWPDVVGWIMLTPEQQKARYGRQYFAPGPVPVQEDAEQQFQEVEARRLARRFKRSGMPEEGLVQAP
jgi:hypothetical protein